MNTIYVVTQGAYSSYEICAVFSTKALAERYIAVYNTSRSSYGMEIEEYPLDRPLEKVRYKAVASRPDVLWIDVYDREENDEPPPDECIRLWPRSTTSGSVQFEAIFTADDAEHARKIAGEKVALAFSGQKVLPVVEASTMNRVINHATLERADGGTHVHFVESA